MLKMAGHSFNIVDSGFSATVWDHELWWNFEFISEEKIVREMDCAPHVRSHDKLILPLLHLLPGARVNLPGAPDEEPSFVMYVHEHGPIDDCVLEFGQWTGNSLEILLTGRGLDFISGDAIHSLELRHLTPFNGVVVMAEDASTALIRLSEHFDPAQFAPAVKRDRAPGFLFKPLQTGPSDSFKPTPLRGAAQPMRWTLPDPLESQ